MSRYERSQFFETLYALRERYAVRSDDDRSSALSIADTIRYAEAVMAAAEAEAEAEETLVAEGAETSQPGASSDPRD